MESLDGGSNSRVGKQVGLLSIELAEPLYVRTNHFQKLQDTFRNILCLMG